ncbi:hypothetical protein PAAG_01688 [Paracoccidioides lutzii Pb01]|uniref:Uncharacterized protein n=1 Tax=Paracoccidioides lutzii (strain ATCC MYA-826 / Pb01) TaxID=502779 RepID=C1GT43_PARBA|nr:hypothetical protein PAAG_01688 [Paracoccidioides lutzii Pb01]EEH39226.2 hypothetical protein PAAG_01688 [Paracoccidioides lutzii Pb01]
MSDSTNVATHPTHLGSSVVHSEQRDALCEAILSSSNRLLHSTRMRAFSRDLVPDIFFLRLISWQLPWRQLFAKNAMDKGFWSPKSTDHHRRCRISFLGGSFVVGTGD